MPASVRAALPGKFTLELQPGDGLSIQTPGGGGWGMEKSGLGNEKVEVDDR